MRFAVVISKLVLLMSALKTCTADDPPASDDMKTNLTTVDFGRLDCCRKFLKLAEWGRAGVAAVRQLALELTVKGMTKFRWQYLLARRNVATVIAAGTFDALVNTLIRMLDFETTRQACVLLCYNMARYTLDHISPDIADFLCLALCRGGLSKVLEVAETLETELQAMDQVLDTPVGDIVPDGDVPGVDPPIDQPLPPQIDVDFPPNIPDIPIDTNLNK